MPFIPALEGRGRGNSEFEASLVYVLSFSLGLPELELRGSWELPQVGIGNQTAEPFLHPPTPTYLFI